MGPTIAIESMDFDQKFWEKSQEHQSQGLHGWWRKENMHCETKLVKNGIKFDSLS
jgi:hypothetical protein